MNTYLVCSCLSGFYLCSYWNWIFFVW